MEQFKPPTALNLDGNSKENWKRWKQKFELYMKAVGADSKDDDVKVAILLHCIGDDALDVYNTMKFNSDPDMDATERLKLKSVLEKFEEYCNPRKNTLFERYLFNGRCQKEGETVDQFVTDLKKMVKNCEYNEPDESMVRDRLVFGIRNINLKQQLLKKDIYKLSLVNALDHCRASEVTEAQMLVMHGKTETVHAVSQSQRKTKIATNKYKKSMGGQFSQNSQNENTSVKKFDCRNCGNKHGINQCQPL